MAVLAFDTGKSGTGISFRNSDVQVTCSTSLWASSHTTQALSSGKYYVEFLAVRTTANGAMVGLTNSSGPTNNYLGIDSNSCAWQVTSNTYGAATGMTGLTWNTGDIICMAIDVANKKAWIRKNNNTWAGGGDPAAGTTPSGTWTFSGDVYFGVSLIFAPNSMVVNSGAGPFVYAAPSGFSAIGDAVAWSEGSAPTAFLTSPIGPNVTLSNSDRTMTAGTGDSLWGHAITSFFPTTGQHYFEADVGAGSTNQYVFLGLANRFVALQSTTAGSTFGLNCGRTAYFMQSTIGYFYPPGGVALTAPIFGANDTVAIAWDADTKTLWMRKPDGTWWSGDPSTGSGGTDITNAYFMGSGVGPFFGVYDPTAVVTMRTAAPWTFDYPFPLGAATPRFIWFD
jgi:hypothetical protein